MSRTSGLFPATLAQLDETPAIPFDALFTFLMVGAVAVSVLVAGLLTASLLRSRRQPEAGAPRQTFGNRNLEIGWTAIPALVIAVIFVFTLMAMRRGPTPGTGLPDGQQPDIEVIGHQWWWEIRYPQHGGMITANEVHLPVGRRMLVQLNSADVQHDFWVPQLGQKMDMYPNKTNYIWLEAREPGTYLGACAEFCGTQHAWMRIRAVAQPPAEFDAWIAEQRDSAPLAGDGAAARGQAHFARYACGNCHAIAGAPFNGQAAPALTNFAARQTIAAGVLENTPENLARYLRDPHEVKPGNHMPNFRLSEAEVQDLVAYLEGLR